MSLCVSLFSHTARGKTIEGEDFTATVADKDTYVDSDSATSNYGGDDWLIFGNYLTGWREAYVHFSFEDKPDDFTKAEIAIDCYSISETFDITIVMINETWSETELTWMNKPNSSDVITTMTVSEEKRYKVDISDYIEGDGISICINASDYTQGGYVQGSSSEGAIQDEDYPQLIWTYEKEDEEPSILGYNIFFLIAAISVISFLVLIRQKRIRDN